MMTHVKNEIASTENQNWIKDFAYIFKQFDPSIIDIHWIIMIFKLIHQCGILTNKIIEASES